MARNRSERKAARRGEGGARSAGRPLLLAWLTAAGLAAGSADLALAAEIEAGLEDGFARIILRTEELPRYNVSLSGAVLIVAFDAPVRAPVEAVTTGIPSFVSASRRDPDDRAIRFALSGAYRVNTIAAGNDLYIDLMPQSWRGAPPSLPDEVIAELSRKAVEAERLAREIAERERSEPAPRVELRVGRHPTFTRLVFRWNRKVEPVLARSDEAVTLTFDAAAELDLTPLRLDMPPAVTGAEAETGEDETVLRLSVPADVEVRGFWDEDTYSVDIVGDAAGSLSSQDRVMPGLVSTRGPDEAGERVAVPMPRPEPAVMVSEMVAEPAVPARPETEATEEAEASAEAEHIGETAETELAEAAPADGEEVEAADDEAEHAAVRLSPDGSGVDLEFPFETGASAAIFTRGETLWLVFDGPESVNLDGLDAELPDGIALDEAMRHDAASVLRFRLETPLLVRAAGEDGHWRVRLGDSGERLAEPIGAERERDAARKPRIVFGLPEAREPVRLEDPATGETMLVFPAAGPARAMLKSQAFVDFTAPATAQGLVLLPRVDDLAVEVSEEAVTVGRAGGLSLSMGAQRSDMPGAEGGARNRTGFVTFEEAAGPVTGLIDALAGAVRAAAAIEDEAERTIERMALARLMLGHELAAEALGTLHAVARSDEDAAKTADFLALRGIANMLMGRPGEARRDLTARALEESVDAHLWLMLALVEDGEWREALDAFRRGEEAIGDYPDRFGVRFRLAAMRAAIERGDLGAAGTQLGLVSARPGGPALEGERALMAARLAEASGRNEDALQAYRLAVRTGDGPVGAEAQFRLTSLSLARGGIDLDTAGEELERLTTLWRGDEVELAALRLLAEVHSRRGAYREAFRVMRNAMRAHPDAQLTRAIEGDMGEIFNTLFLDGEAEAMPAVRALALYYDFRELTPPGRRGDEMIRRLAERLVGLDLLPQAAELLEHQVRSRLRGAARAKVAARLALVHLLDRKPQSALRALSRTRQAQLPQELVRERLMLEARALTVTERADLAVELLAGFDDVEAARTRADALWQGEHWQRAAEAFELLMDGHRASEAELGETARADLLRAAIGYALAGDQIGLDRLRGRYLPRMADTADSYAFEVVTRPIEARGSEFGAVAAEIAAMDTMDAFLEGYRARYFGRAEEREAAMPDGARQG